MAYNPDPANYTMKANKPKSVDDSPAEPLTLPELAEFEKMDRKALYLLLQKVCGARWGQVAQMTPTQLLEATKLKLWHGGLSEPEILKALPTLNAAMDREFGKPGQSFQLDATVKTISVNATIHFADDLQLERDNVIIDHVDNMQAIE